jgi:hypothetical protein
MISDHDDLFVEQSIGHWAVFFYIQEHICHLKNSELYCGETSRLMNTNGNFQFKKILAIAKNSELCCGETSRLMHKNGNFEFNWHSFI